MTKGGTCLHIAAQNGYLEIARLLLEDGADKDAAMTNGLTCLHIAAQNGYLEIVRLLLEVGADKDAETTDGWTCWHVGSQNGHLEILRLLLESGAKTGQVEVVRSLAWGVVQWIVIPMVCMLLVPKLNSLLP